MIRNLPCKFSGCGLAALIIVNVPDQGVLQCELPDIMLRSDDLNPKQLDYRIYQNYKKAVRHQIASLRTKRLIRTEKTYRGESAQPLVLIKRNYPLNTQP